MNNRLASQYIKDIVSYNHSYAPILHTIGIRFFENENLTLEEVCANYGFSVEKVIQKLESVNTPKLSYEKINSYPVEVVVSYLIRSHRHFIRHKFPYFIDLISHMDISSFSDPQLAADLKLIFPEFVEEFIHHIHKEEDTLFSYIQKLNGYLQGHTPYSEIYFLMEKKSISSFAVEHDHEDEMEGIRTLTSNYSLAPNATLCEQLLLIELENFDNELKLHAKIEDSILFFKAIKLEDKVRQKIALNISYN